MFLSIFLSFVLSREFRGRAFALSMIPIIVVVSYFSAFGWAEVITHDSFYYLTPRSPIPLSFPFHTSIDTGHFFIDPIPRVRPPMYGDHQLYFLTVEIGMFVFPLKSDYFILVFSFFVLVNLVGGIVGYWLGKSAILESFFARVRRQKELPC